MRFFEEEFFKVSIFQCLVLQFPDKQQMHPNSGVLPAQLISRYKQKKKKKTKKNGQNTGAAKGRWGLEDWYQRHWFPDFFTRGAEDGFIAPAMFGFVRFCNGGEFCNVFAPPVMRDGRVVAGEESLGEINLFVVR